MSRQLQMSSHLFIAVVLSLFAVNLVNAEEWVQWQVEDGGNNHFYKAIFVPEEITWPMANMSALQENRFSHLVTITSQEENDFVSNLLQPFGFGWIGGIQTFGSTDSAEGWRWVTDEKFVFTNWFNGEPNDLPFDEVFLEIGVLGEWNDCCGPIDVTRPLYVVESIIQAESEVAIDIKPRNTNNSINTRSKGIIRVAILTNNDFDASVVDPHTVRFGPGMAKAVRTRLRDIDYDGDLDMVSMFKKRHTAISCDDTEAVLTGITFEGVYIVGKDLINVKGCGHQ